MYVGDSLVHNDRRDGARTGARRYAIFFYSREKGSFALGKFANALLGVEIEFE